MTTWRITDPNTGMTLKLTGDSPPTEAELENIFASYRQEGGQKQDRQDNKSFVSDVGESVSKRLTNAYGEISNIAGDEGGVYGVLRNAPRKVLRVAGQGAGFLNDVTGAGISSLYRNIVPDAAQEAIADTAKNITQNQMVRSAIESVTGAYQGAKERFPEGVKDIEAVVNIAGAIPAAKGIQIAGRGVAKKVFPKPTPEEAMGQVLQGKTKDVAKGWQAFDAIETKGIKKYSELNQKLDEAIPVYAEKVDAVLSKDPTPQQLPALSTIEKTKGGTVVRTNYVEDAFDHLSNLYEKINDPVSAANIEELRLKALTTGLTKKEVNDLARQYNVEFGDKAFNKVSGEALTSVNAENYENVRKGIKEVARRGMGQEAKELDSVLSSIYNTKRLISKNVEAVNRLRQKVDERSIGEKTGRVLLEAADVLTLGIAKGALLKTFPRGLGYKTKNFIDLEDSLKRNLKIIQDQTEKASQKRP